MNKTDLVNYVSNKVMITEQDASQIVDVLFQGIRTELGNGKRVTINNFGSFFLLDRKKRTALDPRNQEVIDVPAKIVIKFKPSKKILDFVNEK
jgi:nucleoid DNA-binding protein